MKYFLFYFSFMFLLTSCKKEHQQYEKTVWQYEITEPRPRKVTHFFDEIKGDSIKGSRLDETFSGDRFNYFEGVFVEDDSINIENKYKIFDGTGALVSDYTIGAIFNLKLMGDSIYFYFNSKLYNTLYKNTGMSSLKHSDWNILTNNFLATKIIQDSIISLAPGGFVDFFIMNENSKRKYANLVRQNINNMFSILHQLQDEDRKLFIKNMAFYKINVFWTVLSHKQNSLWLINEAGTIIEGVNGFYTRQKFLSNIQREDKNTFYKKMLNKNLSIRDKFHLAHDLKEAHVFRDEYVKLMKHLNEVHPPGSSFKKLKSLNKELSKGIKFPEISFSYYGGTEGSIADFTGSFLLLDFWSTTCAPCIRDHKKLKLIFEKYKDNNFKILALCSAPQKMLSKFLRNHDLPWEQALILPNEQNKIGIYAIPTYYLLNPNGEIIATNKEIREDMSSALKQHLILRK